MGPRQCFLACRGVFGEQAIQGEIVRQMTQLIGERAAYVVQEVIESASRPSSGIIATGIGIIILFFGASNVFYQLQGALNKIWGVTHEHEGWFTTQLKQRLTSVAMIFTLGFLLLLSLLLDTLLAAFSDFFLRYLPVNLLQGANYVFGFSLSWLLFAAIFKTLPQTNIRWNDVWGGALLSAVLFSIGKVLLSFYVSRSFIISAFGAAGSIVVIMFWFYYSSQILFLGAEFAHAYARKVASGKS